MPAIGMHSDSCLKNQEYFHLTSANCSCCQNTQLYHQNVYDSECWRFQNGIVTYFPHLIQENCLWTTSYDYANWTGTVTSDAQHVSQMADEKCDVALALFASIELPLVSFRRRWKSLQASNAKVSKLDSTCCIYACLQWSGMRIAIS